MRDQRRSERTADVPPALQNVEIRSGDVSIPARVLDISAEGLGIEIAVPIAIPLPGAELRLYFPGCKKELRATLARAERKGVVRLGLFVNKVDDRAFLGLQLSAK